MDAKSFLRQLRHIDCMIENKLIERNQWKSIAMGTTAGGESVKINGVMHNMERVQTSGSQQRMADAVGRYMDIEREVNECIDRLVDTKKDVISVIEQLETNQYDILHKKYVQYLTFSEIAVIKNKSESNIISNHGIALKNVQKILDERENKKNE